MSGNATRGSWLVIPRPITRPSLRVFICPFIGGGVTYWRAWLQLLPADVEAVVYLLPGRERRISEPPLRSMTAVVCELARASEAYLGVPFVMFGHSTGADIAFELTHHLRERHGILPALLAVSSAAAPHLPRSPERVSQLPTAELIRRLASTAGSRQGVLRNREILKLMVPTMRADCEVAESFRYRPRGPLACDLLVLGGEDDSMISSAQVQSWREHAARRFTLETFPGGHFYFKGRESEIVRLLMSAGGHPALMGRRTGMPGQAVAIDRQRGREGS
jgi:medium-chain acyl-[acyl-carrier-protein] hydrolase